MNASMREWMARLGKTGPRPLGLRLWAGVAASEGVSCVGWDLLPGSAKVSPRRITTSGSGAVEGLT